MQTVGIRELKQKTSQLVRQVRESGSPIQITYHGTVVALLVPVEPPGSKDEEIRLWAELDDLAAQIALKWPAEISASRAITEDRD